MQNSKFKFLIILILPVIILTSFSSKFIDFTKTELKFLNSLKYTESYLNNLNNKTCFPDLDFTPPNTKSYDVTKFLLPIPFGGPSNQILGFQAIEQTAFTFVLEQR